MSGSSYRCTTCKPLEVGLPSFSLIFVFDESVSYQYQSGTDMMYYRPCLRDGYFVAVWTHFYLLNNVTCACQTFNHQMFKEYSIIVHTLKRLHLYVHLTSWRAIRSTTSFNWKIWSVVSVIHMAKFWAEHASTFSGNSCRYILKFDKELNVKFPFYILVIKMKS